MARAEHGAVIAVLSYHSWQTPAEQLRRDVEALRRGGWRMLSAPELAAAVESGDAPAPRCAVVTTDDGHAEDEDWASALRAMECPAITFVCSDLVPAERRPFYRALAADDLFAVEDHGRLHERVFASARLLDYVRPGAGVVPAGATSREPGAPVLPIGGAVAHRAFVPHPEALAWLREVGARSEPGEIGAPAWRARVERQLWRRGLAVARLGRIYLRGHFETEEQYRARVADYLRGGRRAFEQAFGRRPRFYAYTWYEGTPIGDAVLREEGYTASFSGRDALQPAAGSRFAIPRIVVDPGAPRPIALDRIPGRPRPTRAAVGRARRLVKQLLGIG